MKVTDTKSHIMRLYRAGCRHTIFLQGMPGIGKSFMGLEAAEELGIDSRQWQATIIDPLELPGLPAIKGETAVRYAFEDMVPTSGEGILIIDELNSAPQLTQCSLYSLVWDRKLGQSKLADGWLILATGNRDKDRGVTQRIPTPLVSRMEFINVEPDHDGWIVWMAVQGGHDSVRAFVKARPDLFVTFKAEVPGPFACPRTWTMTSKVMNAYGHDTPPYESIAGWVGEGPATEFLAYHQMALDLPDPDTVIRDPEKAPVPNNPGALYALTTSLAGRANYTNFGQIIKYIGRIPVEFAVYTVSQSRDVERGRMARLSEEEKKKHRKLRENKAFSEWALAHHELVVE